MWELTLTESGGGHDLDGLHAVAHANAIHDVHAARDAAEDRVLAVEEVGVSEGDVELAARGIGMLAARHRHRAAVVLLLVELRLDLVAGIAGAELRIALRQGLRQRIAALDDERRLHAVEGGAVVEALLGELDEVLDR